MGECATVVVAVEQAVSWPGKQDETPFPYKAMIFGMGLAAAVKAMSPSAVLSGQVQRAGSPSVGPSSLQVNQVLEVLLGHNTRPDQ